MVSERYSRQALINGWDQEKLNKTKAMVIGDDILSDLITLDLLALGAGQIFRFGRSDFIEFDKINPECEYEDMEIGALNLQLAEIYSPQSDFIIDASNDPIKKDVFSNIAKQRNTPFFSGSATNKSFFFSEGYVHDANFKAMESEQKQGALNSIVCAAMLTEEVRKRIFKLQYDISLESFFFNGLNEEYFPKDKKYLLAGAGAAGTFAALGIALKGGNLTIVDFDIAEESNLNRQIFFYDSVSKYKSIALAKKLKKYGGNMEGLVGKIEDDFPMAGYEGIVSCVDDFASRACLNRLATKNKIPLINCGVSIYEGEAMSYIPKKTACLDCQMGQGLTQGEIKEAKRSGCIVQPSLILPNQIVGGLSAHLLNECNHQKASILRYGSGEGIFKEEPKEKCNEQCQVQGRKKYD